MSLSKGLEKWNLTEQDLFILNEGRIKPITSWQAYEIADGVNPDVDGRLFISYHAEEDRWIAIRGWVKPLTNAWLRLYRDANRDENVFIIRTCAFGYFNTFAEAVDWLENGMEGWV